MSDQDEPDDHSQWKVTLDRLHRERKEAFLSDLYLRSAWFSEHMDRIVLLPSLISGSIYIHTHVPQLMKQVLEVGPSDEAAVSLQRALEATERIKPHLERERFHGSTLYVQQALVSMWSLFEHHIEDIMYKYIAFRPEAIGNTALEKVTVPLPVALRSAPDEYEAIIRAAIADSKLGSENAVTRIGKILAEMKFDVGIDDIGWRTIREAQQVRHVIVHRRGIVDGKFLSACKHVRGMSVGDEIQISQDSMIAYANALSKFAEGLRRSIYNAVHS